MIIACLIFIEYERQLDILAEFLIEQWNAQNTEEVNALTDSLMGVDENHCGAGINSFALAPNGLLYICSEAYMRDESSFVGDLKTGVDSAKVHQLYHLSSPVCEKCGEKSCTMCPMENKKITENTTENDLYKERSYL